MFLNHHRSIYILTYILLYSISANVDLVFLTDQYKAFADNFFLQLKQDVSKNPTECDPTDHLPSDEQLVNFCTPLITYIEGKEETSFVQQLNDIENNIDDQSELALPELPELNIASGWKSSFHNNEAFSEGEFMSDGKYPSCNYSVSEK